MLAPHHWHDYKKQYGWIDEFVASHPEVSHVHSLVPYGHLFPIIIYCILAIEIEYIYCL